MLSAAADRTAIILGKKDDGRSWKIQAAVFTVRCHRTIQLFLSV